MLGTNALLVEIAQPGPLDRNGDPGAPVAVWSGSAAGYLKRVRRSTVSGGQQVTVHLDVFTLLGSQGAPVLEQAGPDWEASTVVIEDQRGSTPVRRRFTVTEMENRAAGTIADSVRLELDNETVVS